MATIDDVMNYLTGTIKPELDAIKTSVEGVSGIPSGGRTLADIVRGALAFENLDNTYWHIEDLNNFRKQLIEDWSVAPPADMNDNTWPSYVMKRLMRIERATIVRVRFPDG